MRTKSLKIKKRTLDKSPSGAFGTYIQLTKVKGVKILSGYGGEDMEEGFNTIKECRKSNKYEKALEEFNLLRKAYKSKVVPKVYSVTCVLVNGEYFPGIVMQHLGAKTLKKMNRNPNVRYEIVDKLRAKLQAVGIGHDDLHSRNVMYFKRKYYAIDFSRDFIIEY